MSKDKPLEYYEVCKAVDRFYSQQIKHENITFLDAEVIRLNKLARLLFKTLNVK